MLACPVRLQETRVELWPIVIGLILLLNSVNGTLMEAALKDTIPSLHNLTVNRNAFKVGLTSCSCIWKLVTMFVTFHYCTYS